ncbi:MAG: chorismate mutase, partial [Clostridia bacterium]|nr:chorismate mutase [Clostridia bacterium]
MEKTPDKTKLLAFREEIDAIDSQLVKLVTERMQTAAKIADYKRDVGMPVFDPVRERQKLAKIAELAGEEFGGYSRQLYSLIFELTRDYENKLIGEKTPLYEQIIHAIDDTPKLFPASPRVACQGTEGAYSMYAAEKLV